MLYLWLSLPAILLFSVLCICTSTSSGFIITVKITFFPPYSKNLPAVSQHGLNSIQKNCYRSLSFLWLTLLWPNLLWPTLIYLYPSFWWMKGTSILHSPKYKDTLFWWSHDSITNLQRQSLFWHLQNQVKMKNIIPVMELTMSPSSSFTSLFSTESLLRPVNTESSKAHLILAPQMI